MKLIAAAVLALAILPGCSVFDRDRKEPAPGVEQIKPRDVTPTRLVEAYTSVSATAELASIAAKAKAIGADQVRKLQQLLKIALAAVDKSTDLWISGEKDKAANALEAAAAAVEEARKETKVATDKGGK